MTTDVPNGTSTSEVTATGDPRNAPPGGPPLDKRIDHVTRTPGRQPSPQPMHLSVPGASTHRVLHETGSGYVAPKFEGKEDQMEAGASDPFSRKSILLDMLTIKQSSARSKTWASSLPSLSRTRPTGSTKILVSMICTSARKFRHSTNPFSKSLKLMYRSRRESVDAIVNHIHSLYAAKLAAYARDDKRLEIRLDKEASDHAVYIDTSRPGISPHAGPRYEQRIDEKYLDGSTPAKSYRVESFRSSSKLPEGQEQQLRCYFVYQCDYPNPTPEPDETRLDVIADKRFLQKATKNTLDIYRDIMRLAVGRTGPVIEVFDIQGKRDKRAVIAYKQGSALGFFSALSDLVSLIRSFHCPKHMLITLSSTTTMAWPRLANMWVRMAPVPTFSFP